MILCTEGVISSISEILMKGLFLLSVSASDIKSCILSLVIYRECHDAQKTAF